MSRLKDRLTIRLDEELLRQINVLASSTNKNASRIIREALVAYLPDTKRGRYPHADQSSAL